MAIRGRQRWKAVPALKQQFADGRDYISCPECKYFLADIKPNIHVVQEFSCQFSDGRVHLTCPKCHALLGKIYWDRPTIGDRIRHACEFQISDMSWRARWITSLVIAVAPFIAAYIYSMSLCNWSVALFGSELVRKFTIVGFGAQILMFLIIFGFVWVFLSPGCGNYNYAWLWWFNNNRK